MATTEEIKVYSINSCTQFKTVHKQAKDLNGARLITLDQAHTKANRTMEASEKPQIMHSHSERYGHSNSSGET